MAEASIACRATRVVASIASIASDFGELSRAVASLACGVSCPSTRLRVVSLSNHAKDATARLSSSKSDVIDALRKRRWTQKAARCEPSSGIGNVPFHERLDATHQLSLAREF